MRIQLLGAIRLKIGDQQSIEFRGNRSRSLFTKLLLCSNQPVSRSVLASLLWPDSSDSQARTNLRRELHKLRQTHSEINASLVVSRESLQWQMSSDSECDVELFLSQCNTFDCGKSRQIQLLSGGRALDVYRGELAHGLNDEWIHIERLHLKEKWLGLLEKYIPLLISEKRVEEAISLLEVFVTHCPYKESAYLQLMQAHLLAGNSALAQHAYNRCSIILRKDLDVSPSSELQELHQRLSKKIRVKAPTDNQLNKENVIPSENNLVGRDILCEEIVQQIDCIVPQGGVHLIMISGSAGIGKTRLVEELLSRKKSNLKLIPTAYCNEVQAERPYHAAISWIGSDAVRKNIKLLSTLHQKILLQNLPENFVDIDFDGVNSNPAKGSEKNKLPAEYAVPLLRTAMTELLTVQCNNEVDAESKEMKTQMVFIDDIQWCDQDSLEWLNQLVVTKVDKPLVVLATRRSEETPIGHPVETLRLKLQSRGKLTDYVLEPLQNEFAAQVVRDELKRCDSAKVSIDVAEICRRAEGNPLYLIEMTRYKATSGALSLKESRADLFPPRIHAVIQERINRLSSDAQILVSIGAVIGRNFTVELIQTVCDFPDDQLIGLIDELWQAKLITESGSTSYDFTHDCIREAGYLALSPPRRRTLHGKVATALEQIHYFDTRSVGAQIALHWDKAGNSKKAVDWYIKAMANSVDVLAMRDVIRYGTAALKNLDGSYTGECAVEQRVDTLLKLAYARCVTDGFGSSSVRKICQELMIYEKQINELSTLYMIAGRYRMYCSFSGKLIEALRHSFQQIKLARDSGNQELILDAHRSKAFVEYQLGRHKASAETARFACDAGAASEQTGEFDAKRPLWSLLMSHAIQAYGLQMTSQSNSAMQVFAKCHSFESCVGDNHLKGLVLLWMGKFYQCCDNAADTKRVATRLVSMGDEFDIGKFTAFGEFFSGWVSYRAADYQTSVDTLQKSLDLYRKLNEHIMFPLLAVHLAKAQLRHGSLTAAEKTCKESLSYARKYRMPAWNPEIHRVQANVAALFEHEDKSVLRLFERSKQVARKQGAALFLLRTLSDEYEYRVSREIDAVSVQSDLKRMYRNSIGHGRSSELARVEKVLGLPRDNSTGQASFLSTVQ